jgi:hypothetical protein
MEAPLGLSSAREAGFCLFCRAILALSAVEGLLPGENAMKTASYFSATGLDKVRRNGVLSP